MLFTSYSFIAFMAAVFLLYYALPKKCQWPLLLVASYVFYFIAGPSYLIFIAITTVSAYLVTIKLDALEETQKAYIKANKAAMTREERKAYKAGITAKKWKWLLLALFINLGILAVLKYTNFAITNINNILASAGSAKQFTLRNLVLPMGISFYTFQTLGYVIDVYRGTSRAEKNPFKLALFVSFFPQLVQGPISRFNDLSASLFENHKFDPKVFSYGLYRILWGYFKKVVIADRILVAVNAIIHDTTTYQGAFVLVGYLFYALELYADFTGGIDITIGIAQAMGIKVTENFIRPYFSKNIKEYWTRWHITMSTWFKDYIFYPISVCKPMLKLSKFSRAKLGEVIGKRVPVYLSAFVVWFATGIWHGASWNFIVWGLMNFAVIMVSQELEPLYRRFHNRFNVKDKQWWHIFQIVRTILLMSAIRSFDCYRDVPLTFRMFGNLFTHFRIRELTAQAFIGMGLSGKEYILLIACTVLLFVVSAFQEKKGSVRDAIYAAPAATKYIVFAVLLLVVVVFGAYGIGYDSTQFIYNQF
ncbi:MAG: MBOAT family protein [Clostridiales bacterium]|nr:MBOAT family protein [Clostridiales bacterium]